MKSKFVPRSIRRTMRAILCKILKEHARRLITLGSIVGAIAGDEMPSDSMLKWISADNVCANPRALLFPIMINRYLISDDLNVYITEFVLEDRPDRDFTATAEYVLDNLPIWLYYDPVLLGRDLLFLAKNKRRIFQTT